MLFQIVLPVALSRANDWPQWQGPDRTAVSKQKGLLQEWPKDGPPLAWKAKKLGGGDSAPSVAGGKLFGMSNRGNDEVVWALSEEDGNLLFSVRDDGTGFDAEDCRPGSGLGNMVDRVAALGGTLRITSAPSRGTMVAGRVPLSKALGDAA